MQLAAIFNAEDAEAAEERRGISPLGNSHCLVSLVHTAFLCALWCASTANQTNELKGVHHAN